MEFGEEFALVQGALISVQTAVGDLQFLSLKNGNIPWMKSMVYINSSPNLSVKTYSYSYTHINIYNIATATEIDLMAIG